MSSPEIEIARTQWADAHRRLQGSRADRERHERLQRQIAAVGDELRKRVGETFTLADLVAEYGRAERWTRDAAAAVPEEARTVDDLPLVEDAAFYFYARGALDYEP